MALEIPDLTPEVYDHLHNVARRVHADHGRGSQTIQPTVLLHEAWAKVSTSPSAQFESRAHFMAVAARAMRQILVDHARSRSRLKRGGGAQQTSLSGLGEDPDQLMDMLALDEALTNLEALDPDAAQVVQLRVFGGLTVAEVAETLDTSRRSVDRTWQFARRFLEQQMGTDDG